MGGWKLEVFKAAMYMAFPVGVFYIFNQPQYFEEWVTKSRYEMHPPVDEKNAALLRNTIKKHNEKYEKRLEEEYRRLHDKK
ncbi:Uncharacterised protein g4460 [Pycnogonum litorale]